MQTRLPAPGDLVHVRSRRYLVERVVPAQERGEQSLVSLACVEDDAQGESLDVLWEREIDARRASAWSWSDAIGKSPDDPKLFAAWYRATRWNSVTATDPELFQAPYRAGIEIKAYQIEPLRRALSMPRVNLFIADDVGLGKTIEAGLIIRELLLRQQLRMVVIAAPPSVVPQWRDEMYERFGLGFAGFDREFVLDRKRERGFAVNPWTTHSRFVISHALLGRDEYMLPLVDWLKEGDAPSLLILDEAHHAAPSSGSAYAIDSNLTIAVRELAGHFTHRLFLSATPHNGHPNSFAALLEILDPVRFVRGVKVDPKLRDQVIVRRLKSDLASLEEGFPTRNADPVIIENLPVDAPELRLGRLLAEYARLYRERIEVGQRASRISRTAASAGLLVLTNLKKRLLSSIEAFAVSLAGHKRALARQSRVVAEASLRKSRLSLLWSPPGADDEQGDMDDEGLADEEARQLANATAATSALTSSPRELELLAEMEEIASKYRMEPDAKARWLIDWIKRELCPDLGKPGAVWKLRRVLVFTEYVDTKRYLESVLNAVIASSHLGSQRVECFVGAMGEKRRERIKGAFKADPEHHPLRILIANDAAREGVNLQAYCADLFHFDVPWNPGRMEQRNGRIDRKLQPSPEVRCRAFILRQRPEDRVLETLLRKLETIRAELGSVAPVIERSVEETLLAELTAGNVEHAERMLSGLGAQGTEVGEKVACVVEELEASRRQEALEESLGQLRGILGKSQRFLAWRPGDLHAVVDASLRLSGAPPLERVAIETASGPATEAWSVAASAEALARDSSWVPILDELRPPCPEGVKPERWRHEVPLRPLVFRAPGRIDDRIVHGHLEHRLLRRLTSRLLAQGFVHTDLRRVCAMRTPAAEPRVFLVGRLALYGERASRLHDELILVSARWRPATGEKKEARLVPDEGRDADDAAKLLEDAVTEAEPVPASKPLDRLIASFPFDFEELFPVLEARGLGQRERLSDLLRARGAREAEAARQLLIAQKRRLDVELVGFENERSQRPLAFNDAEWKQREDERRYWQRRVAELDGEIIAEPARIERVFEVRASRLEAVAIVYLWPVSG
jgi:superfamily II DNA or RNA helicase